MEGREARVFFVFDFSQPRRAPRKKPENENKRKKKLTFFLSLLILPSLPLSLSFLRWSLQGPPAPRPPLRRPARHRHPRKAQRLPRRRDGPAAPGHLSGLGRGRPHAGHGLRAADPEDRAQYSDREADAVLLGDVAAGGKEVLFWSFFVFFCFARSRKVKKKLKKLTLLFLSFSSLQLSSFPLPLYSNRSSPSRPSS